MTATKEAILKKHTHSHILPTSKWLHEAMDEYLEQGAASLRKENDELKDDKWSLRILLDAAKSALDQANASNEAKEKECERLKDVLERCDEYFDNYADADYVNENYSPNPEMKLLSEIRQALKNKTNE